MKNKLIGILILTVLLGGLIAALLLLPGGEEEPLPDALQELERVFDFSSPVRTIVIEQTGKEPFTLENRSDDPETTSGMLASREHLPVDTAKISAVLKAAGNLPYTQLVHEETDNYAMFGLDPAAARVRITAEDGQSVTLLIGDITAAANGRYLRLEGESAVYLVPIYTLDNYLLSEYDYLSHTITPSAGFPLRLEKMVLSGGGREEEIIILPTEEEGYFRLSKPVSHELDTSTGYTAVSEVFGMQSGNIARIDLTEEALADFGLDEPWASVSVESEAHGSFTVRATAPDADGHVFLYREGVPVLYTAEADSLSWLSIDWFSLISKIACWPSLEALSAVTVTAKERSDFVLSSEGEERIVSLAGESLDYENFVRFYEYLVSARFLSPATEEPQGDALLTIDYLDASHGHTHARKVEIFPSEAARRHLIRVDGGAVFLVESSYYASVTEQLERLLSGAIVPTYLG